MSPDLFELLPAVYRIRDAQLAQSQTLLTAAELADLNALQAQTTPLTSDQQAQLDQLTAKAARGPLQSLLMLVAEQIAAVAYDLDQLYDDQFIETCASWVIPYIGDLIGYQSIKGITAAVDNPRAEVAETISLRRRKGTVLVMEQLARDVTGWSAHAVEFFRVLADTQYMNHIRLGNHYAPDLRRWQPGLYIDTGFDRTAHKVDVRRIASGRGRYNIQNIGIFLWSLSAYSVTGASPTAAATNAATGQLCYRFSSLGMDIPLFHRAVSQGEQIAAAAQPVNVVDRLRRRVLCDDLQRGVGAAYYGIGKSLVLYIGGQPLNPYPDSGGEPLRRRRQLGQPALVRQPLCRGRRSRTRPHRASAARRRISRACADILLFLRLQRRHGRRRIRAQRRLHRHRRRVDHPLPRPPLRRPCRTRWTLR